MVKLYRFILVAASLALSVVAAAQSYSIRLTFNTNLRTSSSLDSAIVETAPAGSTLQVVGQFNRWLKINRNGNEVWMAAWVSHTRVEDSGQTSTQTETSAPIDNCCFVDRQCTTDQEWTDGYWAFQNGQCAAPSQSQSGTSAQPTGNVAGPIDNCCQAGGWQCHNDADWERGYFAFQNDQCEHPGVVIEGAAGFVAQFKRAFELLRNRAPHWYSFVISELNKVKQEKGQDYTFASLGERALVTNRGDEPPPGAGEDHFVRLVLEVIPSLSCENVAGSGCD